jgi:hypothetical protein
MIANVVGLNISFCPSTGFGAGCVATAGLAGGAGGSEVQAVIARMIDVAEASKLRRITDIEGNKYVAIDA